MSITDYNNSYQFADILKSLTELRGQLISADTPANMNLLSLVDEKLLLIIKEIEK